MHIKGFAETATTLLLIRRPGVDHLRCILGGFLAAVFVLGLCGCKKPRAYSRQAPAQAVVFGKTITLRVPDVLPEGSTIPYTGSSLWIPVRNAVLDHLAKNKEYAPTEEEIERWSRNFGMACGASAENIRAMVKNEQMIFMTLLKEYLPTTAGSTTTPGDGEITVPDRTMDRYRETYPTKERIEARLYELEHLPPAVALWGSVQTLMVTMVRFVAANDGEAAVAAESWKVAVRREARDYEGLPEMPDEALAQAIMLAKAEPLFRAYVLGLLEKGHDITFCDVRLRDMLIAYLKTS